MISRLVLLGTHPLDPRVHGNKALGLWELRQCSVRVPQTVIVPAGIQPDANDLDWIVEQLGNPLEYFVRSSSSAEDSRSESLAGVFTSEPAEKIELLAKIAKVREQAVSSKIGPAKDLIPVLIQRRLTGGGGVYLFDQLSGCDSLALSNLGPSTVTLGISTSTDRIPAHCTEYKNVLRVCRELAQKLSKSVDIELVLNSQECVFLQCRPLTQPLNYQLRLGLTDDFPTWLPKLCGTLWVELLNACIDRGNIRYEDGLILDFGDIDAADGGVRYTEYDLDETESYYTKVLFPKWDSRLGQLMSVLQEWPAEIAYREVKLAWQHFFDEYFNNPYAAILDAARAAAPIGMALSPRVRTRLLMFAEAVKEASSIANLEPLDQGELLSLNAVAKYLIAYGFFPLQGHDFSQPSLAELPDVFEAMLLNSGHVELPEMTNPSPLLRVAWLAEDDNEYKQRFCTAFRQSVLKLGNDWHSKKILVDQGDIWCLSAAEVEGVLDGGHHGYIQPTKTRHVKRASCAGLVGDYSADILSPGEGTGFASRLNDGRPNQILIRTVIQSADYPLLLNSNGAVVALGSYQSHGAIFARDIGKPIYRCPAVVQNVTEGAQLTLLDKLGVVRVGVLAIEQGAIHED